MTKDTVLNMLTWLWENREGFWVGVSVLVFVWVGMAKDKKENLGNKLPRLAHLLDLFSAIGMNLIEAKKTFTLIKSGAPYTLPTSAQPTPAESTQKDVVSDKPLA